MCDRCVQPAARGPNAIKQSGFLCGLICLIALGFSVTKVAHPWYTTICETGSLINACDLHPDDHRAPGGRCTASSFNRQSQCNQLGAFT